MLFHLAGTLRFWTLTAMLGLAMLGLAAARPPSVHAGPPSYLLLRRGDSPGLDNQRGQPTAQGRDVRATAYAYGWFGAAPRQHVQKSYGYRGVYTQWSFW